MRNLYLYCPNKGSEATPGFEKDGQRRNAGGPLFSSALSSLRRKRSTKMVSGMYEAALVPCPRSLDLRDGEVSER
jgi:hypothetical protein